MSSLHLAEGTAPTGPDQVALDAGTVNKYHFVLGKPVTILLAGPPHTFTLTGVVRFGTADNLAGATIAAFDIPTAQVLFNLPGKYNSIEVLAKPGVDKAQLQSAIAAVLPKGIQVVTGQTVANEQESQINQALGFFSTALLVFAFISLFVGAFTIFNTFSIIVGQRTKELALLRILGASRRQLFRSVLGEAAIVGLLASLIGLGLGVLTALGLEALLKGFGITLPTNGLVFSARTVIVSILVGVVVTVVSAIGPARRAVRIPPVAALADVETSAGVSSRRRTIVGSTVGLVGLIALGGGLSGHKIQFVGIGAAAIFVAAAMLAPLVARPMASVIGRPLAKVMGIPGKLGRENSMRSPRRTAQTASALMVGLALVSTIAVFGASLSQSATSSIDQAISADYIVSSSSANGEFSNAAATTLQSIPGVTAVASVYIGQFLFRSSISTLAGFPTENLSRTLTLRMSSGTIGALSDGELLIDTTTANSDNLSVGSVVPVKFPKGTTTSLRVGGIFKPNALIGSFVVSQAFYLGHYTQAQPIAVLVKTSAGASATGKATLLAGLKQFPDLKVQTQEEFKQQQQKQVNQLLSLVYVLLALAV
ncbi:MAG TPA: FtsX-like permease family protein, partial [Acidimicrobiales bacterium]|nr:FtsX-like permease family protein [Acidimicrobiales bacterium]